MKIPSSSLRFLLIVVLLGLFVSMPGLLPSPIDIFTSQAQSADPCRPIGGTQNTSGNCVTTNYLLVCDGPGGTPSGGALFSCSSQGCDLGGGGFSISVICNRIDPGIFFELILF